MFGKGGCVAEDYVWLSTALVDPRHSRPITHDISEPREGHSRVGLERAAEAYLANERGETLTASDFPSMIFPAQHAAKPSMVLTHLFFAGSYWVLSSRCAAVLREFDLGAGGLYPVKVTQKDRVTPIGEQPWFCLNFGNTKVGFVKEASERAAFGPESSYSRLVTPWSFIKDWQCAVTERVVGRPDLWIDTTLNSGLFLSRALGDALKIAKVTSGWGLRKCRVVAAEMAR